MITPYKVDRNVMVSSIELYKALGLDNKAYNRWTRKNILNNVCISKPHDFIVGRAPKPGWPEPAEYFLSLHLALHICIKTSTVVASQVKKDIEQLEIITTMKKPYWDEYMQPIVDRKNIK